MSAAGALREDGHGERSASEADAKKDRESVGQTPANTAHAAVLASDQDTQSGRWGALGLGGAESGRWGANAVTEAPAGIGPAGAARSRAQRGPDGSAGLPRLNKNNSTERKLAEGIARLTSGHRKTAYALQENVRRICKVYGVGFIGFLTLTFADHVTDIKEASRRFNSLRTHVLAARYVEFICVVERQKSGRIHFHLLVVLPVDIREGFDFAAMKGGDYRSANLWLRSEWAFWRTTAKAYGFGRTELMPVKSNDEGLAKYVGKYIAKHINQREECDKGARLVRYSRGARRVGCRFSFVSPRSWLWRAKLGQFANRHCIADFEGMREKFGSSWAFHFADTIRAEELRYYPTVIHAIADDRLSDDDLGNLWGGEGYKWPLCFRTSDSATRVSDALFRGQMLHECVKMWRRPKQLSVGSSATKARRVEVVTLDWDAETPDAIRVVAREFRN